MINKVLEGCVLRMPVQSGVVAGDPEMVGQVSGVAITSRDALGYAQLDCEGVFDLSVKGVNDAGNVAVAVGDTLYWVTGDTPKLSKKATAGKPFGVALEAVDSAATATINVKVFGLQAPGYRLTDAHIADASTVFSVTGSDQVNITTLNAALNTLAGKLNAALAAMEKNKLLATS